MADYRIVWVHGIGTEQAGYSNGWRAAFNAYLHLPDGDFIEVLWNTVFTQGAAPPAPGAGQLAPLAPLSALEDAAEAVLRADLQAALGGRAAAVGHTPAAAQSRSLAVGSFSFPLPGIPPDVFTDAYIGEFTKYLVSPTIRSAVKGKLKDRLRTLAGSHDLVSIIAHSWGTVVAYESLMDLSAQQVDLQIVNLITLGCPLWVVRPFLDYSSGAKPTSTANWLNIFAEGDIVGSYLRPSFAVDGDQEVPNFGDGDPHGSYFLPGNVPVQHDLVAHALLG